MTFKVWEFEGLIVKPSNETGCRIANDDINKVYYKFCFDEQKALTKGDRKEVYCTSKTTATGNHLVYAKTKHPKDFIPKTFSFS